MNKEKILEFLKKNNLGVISTSDKTGKPESAVMAITVLDDLTILMNTEVNTRKIVNISMNPQVSLIIGGLKGDPSVQIDGTAEILNGTMAKQACENMLRIHPELKDYGLEEGKFISVKPKWLRWSDFSQNPPVIEEQGL